VSVGHGLDGLLDDGLDNGSAGNDGGDHWGRGDHWGWGGHWGRGNVVRVVHVWVEVVWVVEGVVGVVEGAVGVGVVVTVIEEGFCVGVSVSLGGGLALGQSVVTEGQGGAASGSDAIVWAVWADLAHDGCWSGGDDWWRSSDNWGGGGVEEWGDHWFGGDHGWSGLDHSLGDHWSRRKGGWEDSWEGCCQWGRSEWGQWGIKVWVQEAGSGREWEEGGGGSGVVQQDLRIGFSVTLVEAVMVVPGVSIAWIAIWISVVASVVVGIVVM